MRMQDVSTPGPFPTALTITAPHSFMTARTSTPALESQTIEVANMVKDATLSPPSIITESSVDSAAPIIGNKRNGEPYWPRIGTKNDIPRWLQDNDFILGGHPMPTHSYQRSFRLWRCLHMETMNIWTHLVGGVAFIGVGITLHRYAVTKRLDLALGDKFAFGISITAAALCFGLSTTFHTLRSHSYHVHHRWGRFDIFGICLVALGSGSSAAYYAAYCDPTAQRVYWGLNGGAALAAAAVLFDTGGGGNKMRTLRGGTFIALAITAMLPIFHGISKLGWNRACTEIGAHWYLSEGLVLLFGVSMFVGRFPERLSPGTFDVWGHSHQIHHVCAVIGQAFHIAALVVGYKFRHVNPNC
jgi:adiponectin receptor